MSKRKFSFTLFVVFLLSAMAVASVTAQPRIPGVSAGNWFKYGDISVHWSSDDPNATVSPYLKKMNETEYIMISIVGVIGTNITCEITTHFKNGTEETFGGYVNIDTGDGENLIPMIISAGLDENDTVYTSGSYSTMKINETVTRTYPDQTRDTNHVNITTEQSNMGSYQFASWNYYWDRSTGMAVEISGESITQSEGFNTTWSGHQRITESDVWVIPEFPSLLILPLLMIATVLAVIVYRRKHTITA